MKINHNCSFIFYGIFALKGNRFVVHLFLQCCYGKDLFNEVAIYKFHFLT